MHPISTKIAKITLCRFAAHICWFMVGGPIQALAVELEGQNTILVEMEWTGTEEWTWNQTEWMNNIHTPQIKAHEQVTFCCSGVLQ